MRIFIGKEVFVVIHQHCKRGSLHDTDVIAAVEPFAGISLSVVDIACDDHDPADALGCNAAVCIAVYQQYCRRDAGCDDNTR